MKTMKRILSGIMATAMVCAAGMTGAFATQTAAQGPNNKTGEGDTDAYNYTIGLTKNMIINSDASFPDETFTFVAIAGQKVDGVVDKDNNLNSAEGGQSTNSADGGPILAGIFNTGSSITATIKYDDEDDTNADIMSGTPDNASDSTKKYLGKRVDFDFSSISYKAPGIYRYTIYEQKGTNASIDYDKNSYTADVVIGYVDPDAENAALSVLNVFYYVNGVNTDDNDGTEESYKNDAPAIGTALAKVDPGEVTFPNTQNSTDLTISKTVTGKLGDKEKYFKFTVNIDGQTGYTYTVDLTNATTTEITDPETHTNPATITADTDTVFYLKDGESIAIKGLPVGTKYSVIETDYSKEGYITEMSQNGADKTTTNETADNTEIQKNVTNSTAFTNTKDSTAPTGVLLNILPFALLVLIALGGFAFFVRSSKKRAR